MKEIWIRFTIWVAILWVRYTEEVLGPKCDHCGQRIKPGQPRGWGRSWKMLVFHADPCYADYHAVLSKLDEEERFDSNIGLH